MDITQQKLLRPVRRTDIGVPRGTYEPIAREQMIQKAKEEKAAERKSVREAAKREEELRRALEGEGQAKRGPGRPKGKKGKGIKKLMKPKKRTISQEEKMKNRLRLVASQIEAGNTNPKLIVEVNDLYKKLYNIDNAYQYLSKKK